MHKFVSPHALAFLFIGMLFSLYGNPKPTLPEHLPENLFPSKRVVNLNDYVPIELTHLSYAIYPTSQGYNAARFIFNKRFDYYPKAIFYPTTVQEVQYVMGILKKYNLKFALQAGGHCFGPGSLSEDYIISVKNFNAIIPDAPNNQVYIGAGCILATVINTLGKINFAIPTGTCPTVGVTGLTLGGGIGLLGRIYGLTCDSVLSITFLTADLNLIEVNEADYPDLFWALLGGGNGSYGIALGFTFKMYPIQQVSYYELLWTYDPNLIPPIMEAWQAWVQDIPETISSVLGIRHPNYITSHPHEAPPLVIRIFGLKVGSEPFTEWQSAFQDLQPKVKILSGSYLDMSKFWIAEPPLPFNKAKSRILMKPITDNVIKYVTRFFTRLEEHDPNYLVYFNFERFGGQIANNQTSFFPKNAFGWWFQAYYWDQIDQNEEVLALSRKFYAGIPKEVSKYCYANIVDYDLNRCYLKDYYGNNVDRLIQIKRKYDPTNLFRWKQGIPIKKQKCHTTRCNCKG